VWAERRLWNVKYGGIYSNRRALSRLNLQTAAYGVCIRLKMVGTEISLLLSGPLIKNDLGTLVEHVSVVSL
jgi:hypothetical protein